MKEAYVMGDAIEGARFEATEDGLQLVLTGDFVRTALKYLDIDPNGDSGSLNFADAIRLNIGLQEATEMCESLYEIKHA